MIYFLGVMIGGAVVELFLIGRRSAMAKQPDRG